MLRINTTLEPLQLSKMSLDACVEFLRQLKLINSIHLSNAETYSVSNYLILQ